MRVFTVGALDGLAAGERSDSVVYLEKGQLGAFQKRLDSLNKKAEKFGLAPIKILSEQDVVWETLYEAVGSDQERQLRAFVPLREGRVAEHPVLLHRVEIEYPIVKLGDWQVVGKLEAMAEGNLMFSVSSDPADQAELAERANHPVECEHCHAKRRRKDGFLLRNNETGEYKEVGSSCIEDFTGIDPSAALFLAKMYEVFRLAWDEFDEFSRSGRSNALETRRFLAEVNFLSTQFGFCSSSKARETGDTPTYQQVFSLDRMLQHSTELLQKYLDGRAADLSIADAVRVWVAEKKEETSFDHNVKLLLACDAIEIDPKRLAFAAASVVQYRLSMEKLKRAEGRPVSQYFGSDGEKMTRLLTVERVLTFETPYGPSHFVMMRDSEGNTVKWKTGSDPSERQDNIGRTMEASFIVKGHEVYRDEAQTMVKNVKCRQWLELSGVPEAKLRAEILRRFGQTPGGHGFSAVSGYKYLSAIDHDQLRGLFVVDGDFSVAAFNQAAREARAACIDLFPMRVLAGSGSFAGADIKVEIIDDLPALRRSAIDWFDLPETKFDGRIPLAGDSRKSAVAWFRELATTGLLFHPDDDPAEVIRGSGARTFEDDEVQLVRDQLRQVRLVLSEDEIYAAISAVSGDGIERVAYAVEPSGWSACETEQPGVIEFSTSERKGLWEVGQDRSVFDGEHFPPLDEDLADRLDGMEAMWRLAQSMDEAAPAAVLHQASTDLGAQPEV